MIVPMYPRPNARMPAISTTMNVMIASVAVTDTLPVGVEPYGTRPNRLQNRMKKKSDSTSGM